MSLQWTKIALIILCRLDSSFIVLILMPLKFSCGVPNIFSMSHSCSFFLSWKFILYIMAPENRIIKKKLSYSKAVLSGHSKIDKTKVFMTNGSLMKVKSIAECSPWSILQYFWPARGAFCNTFDLHEAILGLLFEWPFKTGFTVFLRLNILRWFFRVS